MSNRIHLTRTKFTNLTGGNETFGYRLYDDYATVYENIFDSESDLAVDVNEENFWKVLDNHDEFADVDAFGTGMFFDGDWYDGEEIKEIANEVERRCEN